MEGRHYPHVRRSESRDGKDVLVLREVLQIVFYIPLDNYDIAEAVTRALEVYRRGVGISPQTICYATDPAPDWEGGRSLLEEDGWRATRDWIRPGKQRHFMEDFTEESHFFKSRTKYNYEFAIWLTGEPNAPTGYEFSYMARVPWRSQSPESVSVVEASVPTEFIEEHGPNRLRELALEMAAQLPFASGHCGLVIEFRRARRRLLGAIREELLRYPGLHVTPLRIEGHAGTQVDGIHWLNFLGPPVLQALGGTEALRARLQSPETTVRPLDAERAVVSLGAWPEAGDLSRGDTLPAYRELARILEPWLHPFWVSDSYGWVGYTEDEVRRWWRRLLD